MQTSREKMSLHLYPTYSQSSDPKSENSEKLSDLSQVVMKSPVSPRVTFVVSKQHLGSQAASCPSTAFLASAPTQHQVLAGSCRWWGKGTEKHHGQRQVEGSVSHVTETRGLVCWPPHTSRWSGRCERSESKWKATETTALNQPAEQEMFLRGLQRC